MILDLNHQSGLVYGCSAHGIADTTARINAYVDAALVARNREQRRRDYLGGSRVGEACARKLVYEVTHAPKDAGRDFDGGIHGFIFLSYGATVILVALNNRWKAWPTIVALVSAIVPYATIPAEIWLQRTGRLAGAWRLDETDDPRDGRWYDRLMRWFLRRPWVLGALIALAVVALFTVLLLIGPPGGRD